MTVEEEPRPELRPEVVARVLGRLYADEGVDLAVVAEGASMAEAQEAMALLRLDHGMLVEQGAAYRLAELREAIVDAEQLLDGLDG